MVALYSSYILVIDWSIDFWVRILTTDDHYEEYAPAKKPCKP